MKTSGHRSLEKYTSHFIWKGSKGLLKVLLWEGVGDRTGMQHIDPTLMAITVFLFRSPGLLNRGPGAQPLWDMFPIPASSLQLQLLNRGLEGPPLLRAGSLYRIFLQLVWTSCRRGYIIIWRPLFFLRASQFRTQFNPSTVKVIFWYSSTGCSCYLHRCISYFDSLAGSKVNI